VANPALLFLLYPGQRTDGPFVHAAAERTPGIVDCQKKPRQPAHIPENELK
jgi:hypothetical protein